MEKNEFADAVTRATENRLPRFGLSKDLAQDIAKAILEEVKAEIGGDEYYIPRPNRKEQALAEFNGGNHDAVCRKYDISRRTLRNWVKQDHEQRRNQSKTA